MLRKLVFLLLLCSISISSTSSDTVENSLPNDAALRSAVSNCLVELRKVLPVTQSLNNFVGTGWDDLRNVKMRQVLQHTFNDCQTTPEGSYLLPDNVLAIPVQVAQFDQLATFHDSYMSYFQSITETINAEASFHYKSIGTSGSFSSKRQQTKLEMAQTSSNLLVTKMKAHSYTLLADPSAGLDPVFKSRLLRIAQLLKNNLILQAKYEAQLIIRDYGMYYISRVEVGAIMEQLHFIANDVSFEQTNSLSEMKVAASAGIQGFLGVSASYSRTVTEEMKQRLSNMTRHVRVNTEGGPSAQSLATCKPTDTKGCELSVDNLVALDHQGEPLFTLITPHMFKELQISEVNQLEDLIKKAAMEYYKHNEIRGCTTYGDVNFAFKANVDDGSCNGTSLLLPFGGVYQTCEPLTIKEFWFIEETPAYRCDQFVQRNSITGDFTCPSDFVTVPIVDFVYAGFEDRVVTYEEEDCSGFFLFPDCSTTQKQLVYKDKVRLRSYSCAPAKGNNRTETGYMFGGLFAKGQINLFTNSESCPPFYFPAKVAGDVSVCLSRDMKMGEISAVPINEIFSCQSPESQKNCSEGYSQHLAVITPTQCEVYYCIQTGVMSKLLKHYELPLIKRPPFLSPTVMKSNVSSHYVRYYENNALVISYPLDYVLNDSLKVFPELRNLMVKADSNNIIDIVNKWIYYKLEKVDSKKNGSMWPGWGIIGGALSTLTVLSILSILSVSAVYSYRRCKRPNLDGHERLNEDLDDTPNA